MLEIIIIAGPNGAGKTSFANQYLPTTENALVFVNADEIARDIASTELTKVTIDLRAAREMLKRIEALVAARVEFMFETTLASLTYAQKIPAWQRLGYSVGLIYLRLPNVEASIDRVRRRVAAGGYGVPDGVVRQRLARVWSTLRNCISQSSTNGMSGTVWKEIFGWRRLGTIDGQKARC